MTAESKEIVINGLETIINDIKSDRIEVVDVERVTSAMRENVIDGEVFLEFENKITLTIVGVKNEETY